MLQIVNDTPFEADRTVQIDAHGNHVWVVVVKGTYEITGEAPLRLSKEQEPVCCVPQYIGEAGKSTCRRENELVFDHPGTSISILGHAWPPSGQSVTWMDTQAQLGPILKTVRVFGDRWWMPFQGQLVASEPQAFNALPLMFERAYGGKIQGHDGAVAASFDANPVGTGFATTIQDLIHAPLPNFEYPQEPIQDWSSQPRPAGFAVIPSNWTPRRSFAGTFDQRWEEERMPLWPDDFDSRFFLAAPLDMVSSIPFRGGELFALRNLSQWGDLSFTLPRVHLSFSTEGHSWHRHHRAQLDRIYVEPDALKVVMVWRSVLNCGTDARAIRKTFIDTKQVVR